MKLTALPVFIGVMMPFLALSQPAPKTEPIAYISGGTTPDTVAAPKVLCIAVLEFVNISPAPSRIIRLTSERIRERIILKNKYRTVDAGQIWAVCKDGGYPRSDSLSVTQMVKLGLALEADYLITGLVADYHEGDIEFKKRRIELLGKLYDCRDGKIVAMESVKASGKGDIRSVVNDAAGKLAGRLTGKIR
ncbi:MAG TPA: hypothetical protein DDW31_00310 [candidate division Zixibacteria bacterium]|jgi:hypothetical protein|nr:hypothetical protein [candidate division Zixibacteria bacterium]